MEALFVVIEGIEGSGKTTLVRGLMKLLSLEGVKTTAFKEPGDDNPIGRAFREMSKRGKRVPSLTSVCLLAAERFWRSEQVLRWLGEGYVVLADRYYLSGMAYCRAEGVPFERFSSIHQGILEPHLYIYLEIPLAVALRRRGQARDRWEETELVREAARLYPEACEYVRANDAADVCVIDATSSERDVLQQAFLSILEKPDRTA